MRTQDVPPRRRRAGLFLDLLLLLLILLECGRGLLRPPDPPPGPPPLPVLVDLSRAPAGELELVPGIGRVRAAAIVEDRTRNGPLTRLEDLVRIPGFGAGTVQRLQGTREVRIRLSAPEADGETPDR